MHAWAGVIWWLNHQFCVRWAQNDSTIGWRTLFPGIGEQEGIE